MSGLNGLESSGTEPIDASATEAAVDRVFEDQGTEKVNEYGVGDRGLVDRQNLYGVAANWTAEFEEKFHLPQKFGLAFALRLTALLADFSRNDKAQHLFVK